jgi:hypothetical protein
MILPRGKKQQLEKRIKQALQELGLLDSYRAWVRETDSCSLIITVVPKGRSKHVEGMCEFLTVKGKQCKLPPAFGERRCPLHLTLSKRKERT